MAKRIAAASVRKARCEAFSDLFRQINERRPHMLTGVVLEVFVSEIRSLERWEEMM